MKKVVLTLVVLVVLGLSGWLGYYFYKKSKTDPIVYKTEKPFTTTIVKKTVATGSIVPRREVQVKSQVSGIIEELYVEAGQAREGRATDCQGQDRAQHRAGEPGRNLTSIPPASTWRTPSGRWTGRRAFSTRK
jgi:hypothetical protein